MHTYFMKQQVAWAGLADKRIAGLCAALGLSLLAACGGGGGGSADNGGSSGGGPAVPSLTTAAQSVEGLLAFMKLIVPATNETGEPFDVTTFVAPTSETLEPDPAV